MQGVKRWGFAGLALMLAAGWSFRELAFALDESRQAQSGTINLEKVEMIGFTDKGQTVGKNGVYISGDTPASTKFVTGRFVLEPGKTPHAPHTDIEEEVILACFRGTVNNGSGLGRRLRARGSTRSGR